MTNTQLRFPTSSFLGFDRLLDELNFALDHGNDSYPPHNIVKTGENDYQIEIAVAGFSEDELSVTLKERSLIVTGEHTSKGREFLHRGISTKKFRRSFRLSEYVEVVGAEYNNGLLVIQLSVVVPETLQPRQIEIKRGASNETDTKQLLQEDTQEV